jgi:hypothetical protein
MRNLYYEVSFNENDNIFHKYENFNNFEGYIVIWILGGEILEGYEILPNKKLSSPHDCITTDHAPANPDWSFKLKYVWRCSKFELQPHVPTENRNNLYIPSPLSNNNNCWICFFKMEIKSNGSCFLYKLIKLWEKAIAFSGFRCCRTLVYYITQCPRCSIWEHILCCLLYFQNLSRSSQAGTNTRKVFLNLLLHGGWVIIYLRKTFKGSASV